MRISVLTLFPDMFRSVFEASIVKRAIDKKLLTLSYINIRNFSTDTYKSVDDHPYGGGVGMILRVDVIDRALSSLDKGHVILLDPQGIPYDQKKAVTLSAFEHLILICGHYEGVDERVRDFVDEEISIGDYVLTGGEIPTMVVIDSVSRLLPGVLTHAQATTEESFTNNLLEYPQFTRPELYKGKSVPKILVSGDHQKINEWRKEQSHKKTHIRRPDLVSS